MTDAFSGFVCRDCAAAFAPGDIERRCPRCGGTLRGEYDLAGVSTEAFQSAPARSMWEFEALLPVSENSAVSLAAGATPVLECPSVAAESGVENVLLKDEARNPTGSHRDRELAVAVTAAFEDGADCVALPTTGAGGQSAAAYAGGAGLDAEVVVPSRAPFAAKAMVNVHGGEMTVVEGRYPDAVETFEGRLDEEWYPLEPFASHRVEGAKTILYEFAAALEELPDAIVLAAGHGTTLVGMARAATELRDLGVLDSVPAFYAAQPEGCAPIVDAFENGDAEPTAVDAPDTICGALEVPDPAGGAAVLESVAATGGGAVAVSDDALLESAVSIAAAAGVEANAACGAPAAGIAALREHGEIPQAATVGIVNPGIGSVDADVLRSHLMRHGI